MMRHSRKNELFARRLQKEGLIGPISGIPQRDPSEPQFLSFAQQRLWFLWKFEPEQCTYNLSFYVRLSGPLQITAILKSIFTLVQRHETLRTTFDFDEQWQEPVQVIAPLFSYTVPFIDLTHLLPHQQQEQFITYQTQEGKRPFSLSLGPLLRCALFRMHEQEHIIAFTIHHIIFDGWSAGIMIRDCIAFYRTFHQPTTTSVSLAPLRLQYADFALWQRKMLQGDVLQKQLHYWKKKLEAPLPQINLRTDFARSKHQQSFGKYCFLTLDEKNVQQLKEFSEREQVTLFMVLITSFSLLLHIYTRDTDILLGTTIANRKHPDLADLIGFFVNTLVIRVKMSGHQTFKDILRETRKTLLEAYENQDIPYERLIDELNPPRTLNRNPLIQVFLTLQNTPEEPLVYPGLTLEMHEVANNVAMFDLSLRLQEKERQLFCVLEYASDLFEEKTIQAMLNTWQVLLTEVLASPDKALDDLPLHSETEYQRILSSWNDFSRQVAMPSELTVLDLFYQQVDHQPDAIALSLGNTLITYGKLNEHSNQLAHHFLQKGAMANSCIGIYVDNIFTRVITLLAVLKIGAVYIPCDKQLFNNEHAQEQIKKHLDLLVTSYELYTGLSTIISHYIFLDREWSEIAQRDSSPLANALHSQHRACIIYTTTFDTSYYDESVFFHYHLTHLTHKFIHQLSLQSYFNYMTAFPATTAQGNIMLLLSLTTGGCFYAFPDESNSFEENYLTSLEYPIDVLLSTPAWLSNLMTFGPASSQRFPFQALISEGENFAWDLIQRMQLAGCTCPIFNWYTMPNAIDVFLGYKHSVESSPLLRAGNVPVGYPLGYTDIFILNKQLHPVPVGGIGELYIRVKKLPGENDLQSVKYDRRYILHHDYPEGLLFETRDRARLLPDSVIEIFGRRERLVQREGYYVALEDVEMALRSHPAVDEACVIIEDKDGVQQLVAYLIQSRQPLTTDQNWKHFLYEQLPAYMHPNSLFWIKKIPTTREGKIAYSQLPLTKKEAIQTQTPAYTVPATELEEIIAKAWREVLGKEQLSIYDNFFDIGGHSMLAVQLHQKLSKHFPNQITVIQIFEYPTINVLTQYLSQKQKIEPIFDESRKRAGTRKELLDSRIKMRRDRSR